MKSFKQSLLCAFAVVILQFAFVGCLVGVRGDRDGRAGGGLWLHDGPWMDGGRDGFSHGEIHPPGHRR
jgi:hypothetical protein